MSVDISNYVIFPVTRAAVTTHFLEGLVSDERVHRFVGAWNNLDLRLGETPAAKDRRAILALYNPHIPDHIENGKVNKAHASISVAFTLGIATRLAPIMECSDTLAAPTEADTAIFYSVSARRDAPKGIGTKCINDAKNDILRTRPHTRTFSTLSPLFNSEDSTFSHWILGPSFNQDFLQTYDRRNGIKRTAQEIKTSLERLLEAHGDNFAISPEMVRYPQSIDFDLAQLAILHVLSGENGVANVHCRNGAVAHELCLRANMEPHGRRSGMGLMVNYAYLIDGKKPLSVESRYFRHSGTPNLWGSLARLVYRP